MELPRRCATRPPGDLGGLAVRLSPDAAIQMVELARQLRRRADASPEVDRHHNRPSRSRLPKARGRSEDELKKSDHFAAFELTWNQCGAWVQNSGGFSTGLPDDFCDSQFC